MFTREVSLYVCFKGLTGYTLWVNPYGEGWVQVEEQLNHLQQQEAVRKIVTVLSRYLKKHKGAARKMWFLCISLEVVFNQDGTRKGANITIQMLDALSVKIGTICDFIPNNPNTEDYYWLCDL